MWSLKKLNLVLYIIDMQLENLSVRIMLALLNWINSVKRFMYTKT